MIRENMYHRMSASSSCVGCSTNTPLVTMVSNSVGSYGMPTRKRPMPSGAEGLVQKMMLRWSSVYLAWSGSSSQWAGGRGTGDGRGRGREQERVRVSRYWRERGGARRAWGGEGMPG